MAVHTLDTPIDDTQQIDQLIPRPPSRPRRFIIAVALVAGSVLFGWAWSTGAITPKPLGGTTSESYGGVKVVEELESDRVIIGAIPIPNHSNYDLRVTDVRIEGLPFVIDEVRWTPNGQPGGPVRPFFVSADQPLPALATPNRERFLIEDDEGPVEEAMEATNATEPVIDLYVIPDCDADWPDITEPAGNLFLRYEYPGRPSWWHSWFEFEQPLWALVEDGSSQPRGLIDETALNAADEFVEIESLRDTMCGFTREGT